MGFYTATWQEEPVHRADSYPRPQHESSGWERGKAVVRIHVDWFYNICSIIGEYTGRYLPRYIAIDSYRWCIYIYIYVSGWWWLEDDFYFSIYIYILGMSSSQLTSSYFSEGLKPPTSHSQLHYWQLVYQRLMIWPMKLWVPFSSSVRDSILGETLHHPASSYCILLIISRFYPLGGAWLTIPPTKTGPAHNDLGFNATFGSWMDWVKIHNDLTATSLEWWVGETIPKPPTSVQWTISQVDEHIHHHQHMRLYVYYIYIKHTYIFIYI